MIKKICINCGSNYGAKDIYKNEAIFLGKFLAKNKIDIIYGGANVGLMGEIANAALSENGKVIGIIPKSIEGKVGHKNLTELYIVETMHERKKMMFEMSDGFIAFPGGLGTLEEILELLTWSQLGFNNKPCGFLNIANYYNKFIEFLDYSVQEKFIKEEHRKMIIIEKSIEKMIDKFNNYKAIKVEKWIK